MHYNKRMGACIAAEGETGEKKEEHSYSPAQKENKRKTKMSQVMNFHSYRLIFALGLAVFKNNILPGKDGLLY